MCARGHVCMYIHVCICSNVSSEVYGGVCTVAQQLKSDANLKLLTGNFRMVCQLFTLRVRMVMWI